VPRQIPDLDPNAVFEMQLTFDTTTLSKCGDETILLEPIVPKEIPTLGEANRSRQKQFNFARFDSLNIPYVQFGNFSQLLRT